jgi:hypothetical protein
VVVLGLVPRRGAALQHLAADGAAPDGGRREARLWSDGAVANGRGDGVSPT